MFKSALSCGASALAMLLLGACKPASQSSMPPPAVEVVEIEERNVQDFSVFTGRTEALQSVEVRSRVSGYLQEINFEDGQQVQAGQELFLIDPRPYQAEAERAEADLKAAQADLTLADSEYRRAKELVEKNAIAAQEFDNKSAALIRAQGQLGSAKARADTANLNLEFTRIKAAIDGQTSEATVSVGNLITPQTELPLTTIVSTNPIYAYAELDERQLLLFIRAFADKYHGRGTPPDEEQPGERTPVSMQLADEEDFPHQGFIDFSDNQVNPETGTITIRAVFEDKEGILLPGYFVRLRLATSPKYDALLVPDPAIGTDQGQKFIYVLGADDTAEYRRVTPGALQDDGWRVVEGSLQPGERVIVEGKMKVRPGIQVDPQPWHQEEAASSDDQAGKQAEEPIGAPEATPSQESPESASEEGE